MAVAGLTINVDRASAVDFTYPFWFEPSAALMKVITDRMRLMYCKSQNLPIESTSNKKY